MMTLLLLLSIVGIATTWMPLLKTEHWAVRAFDFPYVQLTFLNLLVFVAWLVSFPLETTIHLISFCLFIVSFIYRIYIIIPYTVLATKKVPDVDGLESDPLDALSILSANVLMYNKNYEGLKRVVEEKDPDLLLMVEPDHSWSDAVSSFLHERYEYHILHPLDNTYGLMMYSKFDLNDTEVRFLVEEDVPSFKTRLTLRNGKDIQFFGVHPKPPSPSENKTSTPRDAELVLIGRESRKSLLPVIVAGDMNDVAWSHTSRLFIRISELLDPRMGRGFFNSYHAKYPFLRWPLDHVFISHHFKVNHMERLDNFNSDHFPIYLELVYDPSKEAKNNIECSDKQDRLEASEKLAKVDI